MKLKISPAILSGDINIIRQQIELAKSVEEIETVQIDVIDALFAEALTVTPQDLVEANIDFGDLKIDFHLMTDEPMDYVWELVEYAQDLPIRAVFGQVEKMSFQPAFLEEVKKHDWVAGLALDLYTPIDEIKIGSWEWIDAILLMAVKAGAQGQKLNSLVFNKIKETQDLITKIAEPVKIFIDGGVNEDNIGQLDQAGVNGVAIGSALFSGNSFVENFVKMEGASRV